MNDRLQRRIMDASTRKLDKIKKNLIEMAKTLVRRGKSLGITHCWRVGSGKRVRSSASDHFGKTRSRRNRRGYVAHAFVPSFPLPVGASCCVLIYAFTRLPSVRVCILLGTYSDNRISKGHYNN